MIIILLVAAVAALFYFGFVPWPKGLSFGPYVRSYKSNPNLGSLPEPSQAVGIKQGFPECKFLLTAKQQLQRDYILLIDRSGSMSMASRWREAEKAVQTLAPHICQFDDDGISVILFDDQIVQFDGVKDPATIQRLFVQNPPRGTTALHKALDRAFRTHFNGSRGATSVLVITDGTPDDEGKVRDVLLKAANAIEADAELSVSFVQIGEEPRATEYLVELDDNLKGAKFDIVDTIPSSMVADMPFGEFIARSLYD